MPDPRRSTGRRRAELEAGAANRPISTGSPTGTREPGRGAGGGATDVGLWVTKALRQLPKLAFLHRLAGLQRIGSRPGSAGGAGVTVSRLAEAVAGRHPDLAELFRRYGSVQVRNAATIGGNIANGSPIGDGPPALIALGTRLTLRRGAKRRELPLEEFFLAWRRGTATPASSSRAC